jgi:hypothetical protein
MHSVLVVNQNGVHLVEFWYLISPWLENSHNISCVISPYFYFKLLHNNTPLVKNNDDQTWLNFTYFCIVSRIFWWTRPIFWSLGSINWYELKNVWQSNASEFKAIMSPRQQAQRHVCLNQQRYQCKIISQEGSVMYNDAGQSVMMTRQERGVCRWEMRHGHGQHSIVKLRMLTQ